MKDKEVIKINKQIFITNGMARCGKDTFAKYLNEIIPTLKYSSIDKVKEIARLCGWDGVSKTEKDRKFLSDLKLLTTGYSNMPFEAIRNKVTEFLNDDTYEIMLIDIREPAEIDKAKNTFKAKTILIENKNIKQITSNMADANVFNYEYDYIIKNNSSLEDFKKETFNFARKIKGFRG